MWLVWVLQIGLENCTLVLTRNSVETGLADNCPHPQNWLCLYMRLFGTSEFLRLKRGCKWNRRLVNRRPLLISAGKVAVLTTFKHFAEVTHDFKSRLQFSIPKSMCSGCGYAILCDRRRQVTWKVQFSLLQSVAVRPCCALHTFCLVSQRLCTLL